MKILVSSFGRQYANDLLSALEQNGWLSTFCTAFSANKIIGLHWLPESWRQGLRKRVFTGVQAGKIRSFPLFFALERIARNRFPSVARAVEDLFDRRVAKSLKRIKPDLVIAYENTNRKTMKTAKELGMVTVLDLAQIHHEDIVAYCKWFMPAGQLEVEVHRVNPRKATALQFTDYVLVLSEFAAQSMLRNGWPADRLYTVNLGIDPERFSPKHNYRSEGPLRLLFVGTMTRRKGLGILFEALGLLQSAEVELTLIGPMADAADILRAHRGQFQYLPFLHHEDLAGHYQQADVFVFPSLLDSWAQTVLESMACGTPAIVSENTGARDAVEKGGGWVIPANDANALCDCLRNCLQNRAEITRRGINAAGISKIYTKARYREQVKNAIAEIARREGIPLNSRI